MSADYSILWRFLEGLDHEVRGHATDTISEEVKERLRQFAQGQLPQAEREVLVREIEKQPHWIAFLAQEVKALRPPSPPRP